MLRALRTLDGSEVNDAFELGNIVIPVVIGRRLNRWLQHRHWRVVIPAWLSRALTNSCQFKLCALHCLNENMLAIRLDFYATQHMHRAVKLKYPENRFEVT
ncbi:hypothetical protein CY34DRAFT_195691 [Suillus luteus UH-Slu-Lm8-n1]|uniref:Uncharacterized protein n=1 Tax=Suillus luteus UH-Slu-Lm8-n1 TaxID=930992 RepID=A0A0D0BEA6_9AGAM|nr:hypothetical protein CY34DRAFT_195691 [Suillus luteus UH-Slu-Lm8-n1]